MDARRGPGDGNGVGLLNVSEHIERMENGLTYRYLDHFVLRLFNVRGLGLSADDGQRLHELSVVRVDFVLRCLERIGAGSGGGGGGERHVNLSDLKWLAYLFFVAGGGNDN